MIKTSNQFKEAIKSDVREIDGFAEIMINGTYLIPSATEPLVVSSDSAIISNNNTVADTSSVFYNYGSFENNYFLLDGSFILPNQNYTNNNTGFIGGINSSTLTINGRGNQKGITIYFPSDEEYAVDFNVTITYVYWSEEHARNKKVDYTYFVAGNEEKTYYISGEDVPTTYYDAEWQETYYLSDYTKWSKFDKIVIEIENWSIPTHRVRIKQVNNGQTILFGRQDVIEMTINEETDLESINVPNNNFQITLNNYDRKFDIVNEDNIINKFNKNTIIYPYLGVSIGGAFEYVQMGSYKYQGITNNNDLSATITGIGSMEDMSSELMYLNLKGLDNLTAREIAVNMLDSSVAYNNPGYNDYVLLINSDFDNKREQLQALAILSDSIIKQYRDIRISDMFDTSPIVGITKIINKERDVITLNQQLSYSKFLKKNKTKKVVFSNKILGVLKDDTETLLDDKIAWEQFQLPFAGNWKKMTILLESDNPIDLSTITLYVNNVASSNYQLFNSYYKPQLVMTEETTNSFENIKVTAKVYNSSRTTTEIINDNVVTGTTLEIGNNLINTYSDRKRIANYIFNNENDYEFDCEFIGNPCLEVGDKILLENVDGYKLATIEKIAIKYDGGLKETIKGVCSNVNN